MAYVQIYETSTKPFDIKVHRNKRSLMADIRLCRFSLVPLELGLGHTLYANTNLASLSRTFVAQDSLYIFPWVSINYVYCPRL